MGRPEPRRSAAAIATTAVVALVAGSLLLATGASIVSAYTVAGAIFVPDHGAPGTAIVVEGLPLAVDCPAVDAWLARGAAPSPPITAVGDPRLLKLTGTVRIRPIGAGGVNDTRPGTTFEFRVPAIEPGVYATCHRCRGGDPGFGTFERGAASFTVDPAPPGTDTAGLLAWTSCRAIARSRCSCCASGPMLSIRRRAKLPNLTRPTDAQPTCAGGWMAAQRPVTNVETKRGLLIWSAYRSRISRPPATRRLSSLLTLGM
jgi:hypothetical protein